MALHVNTFKGGLDLDTDVTAYDNTHYPYALNLRIISDGANTSGTLTSMEDSAVILYIPSGNTIVGRSVLREYLIMFLKNTNTGEGRIYKIPFSAITEGMNISSYLMVTKQFAFGDNVQIVARYETPLMQKIYWVDGINVVRFANLALSSAELSAMTLDEFNIIQEVTLSTPTLSTMTLGTLKVGIVQYAYCLYNLNGSETGYSSASNPIPISTISLIETTSLLFRGSNIDEISNKGVTLNITGIDTTFDRIRVIRLHYSEPDKSPIIDIIYEGSLTSSMTIADTGNSSLGSLILEDYRYIPNIFSAKTLETKNDYLFAGNIVENSFNVNFDARVYRFNSSGQNKLYNSIYTVLQWDVSTKGYNVPEEYDCLNPYNIISADSTRPSYDNCKFKSNGTQLGGTGKYLEYNFVVSERIVDSGNTESSHLRVYTTSGVNGYQDLSNPLVLTNLGYQRDEIYRFAIVFFDKYGRQSFAKWIGDIRFPSEIDGWWYSISGSSIRDLGIEFTINSAGRSLLESQGVVSWQIVRAERTYADSTIKDCGYLSSLYNSGSNMRWRDLPQVNSADNNTPLVLEYITPETNYNKNNYSTYNRLDVYSGHTLKGLTSKNTSNVGATCITFKLDGTVSQETPVYKTISKSLLYKYTGDIESFTTMFPLGYGKNLSNRFGPMYSRDSTSYDPDQFNRCTKGTTLLLKIDGSAPTNGVKYTRRRSYTYPYGGSGFGNRLNTRYYPCGVVSTISTTTRSVFGGDCYIGWFEYMRGLWSTKENIINSNGARRIRNMSNQIAYLLVETKINLKYTINPTWSYYDDGVIGSYSEGNLVKTGYEYNAIREVRGIYELDWDDDLKFTQTFDLYTYNPIYSQMDKSKVFFPEPLDFVSNNSIDTRIYRTNNKINGENSDTWTKFLQNNFLDVDTTYEGLTKLLIFNDKLIYFQPKGVGVIPIAEREVVTTNSGSATTIGTGGVMTRYDYITTTSGASTLNSIENSTKAIYYIDSLNKKLCRLSEGVEFLSDLKGIRSFTDNKSFINLSTLFNSYNNEIWFRIQDTTVVFNEYLNSFLSFVDESFKFGISYDNKTYTFGSEIRQLDMNNRYKTPVLKLTVTPSNQFTSRFDSITVSSIVSKYGALQNKSFTNIALSNGFQTRNSTAFNARERFRQFIFNDMRDNNGNRLFDNYCNVQFTFTPSVNTERIQIRDVVTNYMPINTR